MKKSFVLVAALLLSAFTVLAADWPKYETFLGYTYFRANTGTNAPSFSANGGGGQFAYNFSKRFSGVVDLGAVHSGDIGGHTFDTTLANFIAGPCYSMRYSRFRPYIQVLVGGVYGASSTQVNILVNPAAPIIVPARISAGQTAFAMTAGGGVDIKINKHISFRPIGLDYYMTRLKNLRSSDDDSQNSLRYTTGFNFTFGAQ